MDRKTAYALLDMAQNDKGYAYIPGVGYRFRIFNGVIKYVLTHDLKELLNED